MTFDEWYEEFQKKLAKRAGFYPCSPVYWEHEAGGVIDWHEAYLPDFPDDLSACFKWLVDPNPDIRSVKFVHYHEPNEEVQCYISLRAPSPLLKGKWEVSERESGGNKYAIALCRAIEQLNSAKEAT